MADFPDHFSRQSGIYVRSRPSYPDELFTYLSSLAPSLQLAWDCGTGNGQAAVSLAVHFNKVKATDASENQIRNAKAHTKVEYKVAPAEKAPLADATVDLVTVATAVHWFRRNEFYSEVDRVLKPDGILAIWSYADLYVDGKVAPVYHHFAHEILYDYWPEPALLLWRERYANLEFPYPLIATPDFKCKADWDLHNLLEYFASWSSVNQYILKHGKSPVQLVLDDLKKAWGNPDEKKRVEWNIILKAGKKEEKPG